MKKLRGLRDGKPKWACADELIEVRSAITILKQYEKVTAEQLENEDEYLREILTINPPKAEA